MNTGFSENPSAPFRSIPNVTLCMPQLSFSFYRYQRVLADFSGGQITSDAGLLPPRAFDQRHHLTRDLAQLLTIADGGVSPAQAAGNMAVTLPLGRPQHQSGTGHQRMSRVRELAKLRKVSVFLLGRNESSLVQPVTMDAACSEVFTAACAADLRLAPQNFSARPAGMSPAAKKPHISRADVGQSPREAEPMAATPAVVLPADCFAVLSVVRASATEAVSTSGTGKWRPTPLPGRRPSRLIAHMQRLRLTHMIASYESLSQEAAQKDLPYLDFLERLLENESQAEYDRNVKLKTQLAHFPYQKRLDQFEFSFQPSIDEKKIRELASLAFLERKKNVILLGPPDVFSENARCVAVLISWPHGKSRPTFSLAFTAR
jgi:IstB-like ATP binding protein